MLDIGLIREKPEEVRTALLKRMDHVNFTDLLQWDTERRALISENDTLRAKRNAVSAQIPSLKKEGKDVHDLLEEMKGVSDRIKALDIALSEAEKRIQSFLEDLPNIPADDVKAPAQFLLPTAETALINFHSNEILQENELPRRYFSYTPCYRKEAGSYRTKERGMIRGHQFNKVEMFQYTRPEESDQALEELIGKAEQLVQALGLHYRVSKLAARDCSASMAKTYDIEVWIPSMEEYKEVSSASNAHDYQARRGSIRFKRESTGRNEYVHTLNASGLATSRLLPAIAEQFQQQDGSVIVPKILQKWLKKDILAQE